MLLLGSTSDKLQLVTGSAVANIDVLASWIDNAAGTISGGVTPSSISTATTTDIVAAPASSTLRNVKALNIRNTNGSNSNTLTVKWTNGTTIPELFKCVLAAGEVLTYVEGLGWDIFASDGSHKAQSGRLLFKALDADDTGGTNVATAQPWFPTAGGVSVAAATTYFFEGLLRTTRAAGAVSHTTGILFGGTATLTNIDYQAGCRTGDVNTAPGASNAWSHIQVATNTQVKAASTATTEDTLIVVNGVVRINATGTFIPQFIYSAAPGGAPTIKRGSFFRMWPIGDNNVLAVGTWA